MPLSFLSYLAIFLTFPERAFQVREKVLAAANWGSGNYLIVKENYIAEQINPHVNIVFVHFGKDLGSHL